MRAGAALLCLLLAACNTLPVGFGEVGDRVPGDSALTLLPDTAVGYARYVQLGEATELYFGRDTAFVSRVILRFSIPETLNLDSIASVELVLHTNDSARVPFVCRPCSTSWNEYGVSWLMADSTNHWANVGGDYWRVDIGADTTGPDSIVVDLAYRTLTEEQRAAVRDNGIVLFPLDTGFAMVQSQSSATKGPRILVTYTDGKTELEYLALATGLIVDTVRISAAPTDLLVGAGLALRSQVLFNLDSIPAAATITQAELRFRPQTRHRRSDTLAFGAHRLTQSFAGRGGSARFIETAARIVYYVPPADSDTTVSLDLRSLVQFWTTYRDSTGVHCDSNFGLLLKADPEWARFFHLRVPRSGPNSPQLRIQYVMPPGDRFR